MERKADKQHEHKQGTGTLRGFRLFSAVYAELEKHAGGEFSTAELMQAAQALIELAKNDYAVKGDRLDASQHSNYYTYDLALAFAQHAWKIACYEAGN